MKKINLVVKYFPSSLFFCSGNPLVVITYQNDDAEFSRTDLATEASVACNPIER